MREFDIYALHGFLGLPNDWQLLETAFPTAHLHLLDLFDKQRPLNGAKVWAKSFNESVRKKEGKRILMGYSLGGRLALHALLDDPSLWSAAIIISANPGLQSAQERSDRLAADSRWASRFLLEPWAVLMEDWNKQAIFANDSYKFQRHEKDFSRVKLAEALLGWSLGSQQNLMELLQKLSLPILWAAGELDTKMASLAKEMKLAHPLSEIWISPESGHRLVWQQSQRFIDKTHTFLRNL